MAPTPFYGEEKDVARVEAYLSKYSEGDGWFGPLSEETVSTLAARIRKEKTAFLATERLE